MREIKYGFFFFLLSKILAVNCIQKNPTNSVQFNGQNAGASNSWPSQPVPQDTMNYYNSINPNPLLNSYLNNNDNQQYINNKQQSPMPQPYNEPHPFNAPQQITTVQQLTPQEPNYLPPMYPPTYHQNQQVNTFQPPSTGTPAITQSNPMPQYQSNAPQSIPVGKLNSNNESVNQQSINMKYPTINQNKNTKLKQPVINQKNEKQQSQVPQSYNLQPPSQGGQGASQYFGTIESSPPKEYQKQLPMSSNQPYPQELPDFSQVINNPKNNENKPVQVPSTTIPQLSQQTSFISKSDIPSNILLPSNENQLDLSQSPPSIIAPISNNLQLPQMPLQSSSKPMNNGSTPNKNNIEIEDVGPFNSQSDVPNNTFLNPKLPPPTQNQLNFPQLSPSNSLISNQSPLPQMPLKSSSTPMDNGSSTLNKNNVEINGSEPFNSQSDVPNDISFSPKLPQSPLPQMPLKSSSTPMDNGSSTLNKNNVEINGSEPFNSQSDVPNDISFSPKLPQSIQNQFDFPQSSPSNPLISNQLPLPQMSLQTSSELLDKGPSTPNKNNMEMNGVEPFNSQSDVPNDISFSPKLPQSTQNQFDFPQSSSLELLNKAPSTPNKNNIEINGVESFNSQSDVPNDISFNPKLPQSTQNQFDFPQSSPSNPLISNQLPLPQIPLQSSSELLDKGPSTPNTNTMQDTKADVSLNSTQGFPDDKSEPLISDVVQNENILIDNSQTDMETFLHPENNNSLNPQNNVSENQDNSKLESNNTLPEKQDVIIIDPQPEPDDLIKDTISNNAAQTSDNASNDTPFIENNEEINLLHSLEHLVFDEPLDFGLYKYDKPSIVDTENPENKKQDKDKITVFANPNDIHTQQISSEQSPTSDNSYLNNNYLLNTPTTNIPWYKPSFPSAVNYVQQPDSNANNQLLSLLLNFNQNPMYPPNNNYYNQQDPYPAYGQNQMISKTKIPSLLQNVNQPSSEDTSGYIYKKVDLKNPPPNISNSWLLLNKDYTKNSNQNNAYTNYDGKISTSISETPSMSYQNNIQGILNLSSNDMSLQNIISAISNLFNVPTVGTKTIFDLTRVNFPRAPMSQIIRLTRAIVQSAMLSLQQTLNTLYGRRAKRDFNPKALHKLPGALINKYPEESTAEPTASNINIMPYYNQPDATGQQPMADSSANQPMFQQQQMNYGGLTDMNYLGSQYNNNNRVVPHPAYIKNYVLSSLEDAITTAIRSNLSDNYSINTPEVKEYIQQVIVTVEIVFKNQIDNTIYGLQPTMNIY